MDNLINDVEVRYATELRADSTSNMVYGTAISFNTESILMGGQFREVVKPSAATADFLAGQEIIMKYNHQPDSVLARYSPNAQRNSLKFSVDSVGVHFEFRAKKGDQYILDSINAGDLNACSFAFKAATGGDQWEKRSDGTYLRTLNKFDVVKDFSLVISPAYEATSCNVRGLDELKQKEEIKIKENRMDTMTGNTMNQKIMAACQDCITVCQECIKEDDSCAELCAECITACQDCIDNCKDGGMRSADKAKKEADFKVYFQNLSKQYLPNIYKN